MSKFTERLEQMSKEKRTAFERLIKAGHTWDEAEELYEYDTVHCESDKASMAYLSEYTVLTDTQVSEAFTKTDVKTGPTANETRVRTKSLKEGIEARIQYLAEAIAALGTLGACVETDTTSAYFVDPLTGFRVSFKVSKHKEQKVVTKVMAKRKKNTTTGPIELDWTVVDLRAMDLHKAIADAPEGLFEAPSPAGTQVGFAIRDEKYPFGSVKMTHHKS